MASVHHGQVPNFLLSPDQQNLLFAALNSNKAPVANAKPTLANAASGSPHQQTPGSGTLSGLDDSPFVDYDYDFEGDGSFGDYDFADNSQGEMIGNLPSESPDGDNNLNEKRGLSDDDDNDEEGGGKRREGDEKTSKKPGRKPLTSEPTSKRKAQNRAAQRAFRERKEKHLKDLETKVQDLEKASESANHENSILRAQVEKMAAELKEYRKKLSAGVNAPARSQTLQTTYPNRNYGNSNVASNPSDVNFHFEFPKFGGKLPGGPVLSTSTSPAQPANTSLFDKSSSTFTRAPQQLVNFGSTSSVSPLSQPTGNDMSEFSGLFSPKTLDTIAKDTTRDYLSHVGSSASRSSFDSIGRSSSAQTTSHNSPASSASNVGGPSSSCGTSPESYSQSPPAPKAIESTLSTIGEENNSLTTGNLQGFNSTTFDVSGIDWLAEQNGNQFDPQLFGDYREPQENILASGFYDDTFFSEAFAMPEFSSPFALEASPGPKKDLVQEIDAKLNEEEHAAPLKTEMLSCTTMWEKLQSCPKVQNGEIDMDSLCSQLQSKAKCSGEGPVIQESDFKAVLTSMFPAGDPCADKF